MRQRKEVGFQRWWYQRKLDILYCWSSLQLALFNAYLYLRYVVKHHRRPEKVSKSEAEKIVKQLFAEYEEQKRL